MYLIFHPSYPGWIWTEVNKDGETDNKILANIISKMREGIYSEKAFKLRCVPNIQKKIGRPAKKGEPPKPQVLSLVAKAKDCTTLGKLFAPKKVRGSQIGLKPISEENRYKGKVNWESKRDQIGVWLSEGLSIRKTAKKLGVPATECIAVEDTRTGVASARAAGMYVVQLRAASTALPPIEEANAVIESYAEFDFALLEA